jgi:hypothetical protein
LRSLVSLRIGPYSWTAHSTARPIFSSASCKKVLDAHQS